MVVSSLLWYTPKKPKEIEEYRKKPDEHVFATSSHSDEDGNNNKDLQLTNAGFRNYFELRRLLADEKHNFWIKWATIVMAIFAVVTAIPIVYKILMWCIRLIV